MYLATRPSVADCNAGAPHGAGTGREFFSEEKNQKTFESAWVDGCGTWPDSGERLWKNRVTRTASVEGHMLRYALLFAIISIVAGFLGFSGISAATAGIAKICFFIAIVVFLIFLLLAITGVNLVR
jgi:uncharacterized membrane protein YtjA (UPF0391 family)